MEDKDKKPTLIASYKTKPQSIDKRLAHIRFDIFSNGVTIIEKRMLVDDKNPHWEVLRPFKDKYYCRQIMSFRLGTLGNIFKTTSQELIINNIHQKDIV